MSELPVPHGPEQLTPEWLTAALRQGGLLQDAALRGFEADEIGAGQAFVGQTLRLHLDYEDTSPSPVSRGRPAPSASIPNIQHSTLNAHRLTPNAQRPSSIIAKFPSANPTNREIGARYHSYDDEIRFYREIAPGIPMRIPRCYYTGMCEETQDYLLLLEDLAPARPGDQVAGCTVAEAADALRALARFHSAWWERCGENVFSWMEPLGNFSDSIQGLYASNWQPYLRHVGSLPDTIRALGERLMDCGGWAWLQLSQSPCTIIHGDYRLDNMLFPPIPGGDPIAIVDWQTIRRGHAMYDAGYFLCESLNVDERRAAEKELVELYHATLTGSGVQGYDLDRCWRDYRLSLLATMSRFVVVFGTLDMSNPRATELMHCMTDRLVAAVIDLDPGALLPG